MSDHDAQLPSILIVDDDPDQLFLTRRMLERTELKNPIVEITGGPETMAYLTRCCSADGVAKPALPAVVFLDLKMPTADGFAVLQWMRCNVALHAVKVIILSSSDDPEDVKRCTHLGAQGYLVKHPNSVVLGYVLRQAMESKDASMTTSTAMIE